MKTNLANLMSIVSEEEKKLSNYAFTIRSYAYNISIQELDGKTNITEDYKNDFDFVFEEVNKTKERIIKIKSAIYQKNNSFTLTDGRTIRIFFTYEEPPLTNYDKYQLKIIAYQQTNELN